MRWRPAPSGLCFWRLGFSSRLPQSNWSSMRPRPTRYHSWERWALRCGPSWGTPSGAGCGSGALDCHSPSSQPWLCPCSSPCGSARRKRLKDGRSGPASGPRLRRRHTGDFEPDQPRCRHDGNPVRSPVFGLPAPGGVGLLGGSPLPLRFGRPAGASLSSARTAPSVSRGAGAEVLDRGRDEPSRAHSNRHIRRVGAGNRGAGPGNAVRRHARRKGRPGGPPPGRGRAQPAVGAAGGWPEVWTEVDGSNAWLQARPRLAS